MRLTRRGELVALAVFVAILSGMTFGARSLNAIAAPGLVALLAALVQVSRIDEPTLTRELPDRGRQGDTVTVRLRFDADTPFSARLADTVGEGLSAMGNDVETTIGRSAVTYDLHLDGRGEHSVGPLSLAATDVLGLVARDFSYPAVGHVIVQPRVHSLAGPRRQDLSRLHGGASDDRQEFDQLRDYRRGDPVRDIHWKSSAKRPGDGLVVKQFTADEGQHTVEIVAEADDGCGDAMAEAAASIAVYLLDDGVNVGLTTPDGRVEPERGAGHRTALLDHLAVAGPGRVLPGVRDDADVVVSATDAGVLSATDVGVRVDLGGREHPFDAVAGRSIDAAGEVGA